MNDAIPALLILAAFFGFDSWMRRRNRKS